MSIRKKIILSNLLMILVPLLLLCLMGGIWLNTVGNRYWKPIEEMYEDRNGVISAQNLIYAYQEELWDTNWEVLESQEDQAVDAKGLRQSPEMVRLQRELTGLGYHFTVLLDEKRLYSNLSEEEFRQVEQLIGPIQEQAKSINVSSDRVSVIKCSFYEDEEECAIIAVNIGMDNPLGSKSYLQRYVLPYVWIFGLSMILVVILVNVCCSKWISSLILPPMKEIRKGMQKVKKGELEGNIRVLRNDELGEVCSEFNEMQLWLKKSKEEQMKYETYRRELISGVSHDLRTPLTTIKGYVGGILDGIANTEEKRRKYLLAVQTRTADLENLIDQLSSYNRMENHMFQYKMEEMALKKAVEDYLEENEEFIVENRLIVSLKADTDGTMRMDQRAFKRIMDNLFTNSIRYREKGQSRIRIIQGSLQRRQRSGTCDRKEDRPGSSRHRVCKEQGWIGDLYGISGELERKGEMDKILIIEDDELIAELERDYLLSEGMEADVSTDGRRGMEQFKQGQYAAVILDLMLPGRNGFEICWEIRKQSDVPILLVTARKEDIDKIKGLRLGADDYVVKPFSPVELVARVKAHIQIHRNLKAGKDEEVIRAGRLVIHPDSYKVYKDNRTIELTGREFELLLFLARNPNIVFSKARLFDNVWGMDAVGDVSTVTVHINKLREKIEDDPSEPQMIRTVWGVGYRFEAAKPAATCL